jgi:hypothetical protein
MGFKTREDKPYTKADHYREMEEKAAFKRMAAFSNPVLISDIKEPAWLDEPQTLEQPTVDSATVDVVDEVELSTTAAAVIETKPKRKTQARKKTSSKKKVKKVENTNS